MDEYIGIIKIFGGNFAPRGWFACNGQLLPISQYTALFSLLGTVYGGDGVTTFALPNLQSRTPIGMGQGPGLSYYAQGQISGSETNTLLQPNIPPHNHPAVLSVSSGDASQGAATAGVSIATPGTLTGRTFTPTMGFNTTTPNIALNQMSVVTAPIGQGMPVNNMQPFMAMNYIICWEGIYPSRP
jgi:microcystin-dependent protein